MKYQITLRNQLFAESWLFAINIDKHGTPATSGNLSVKSLTKLSRICQCDIKKMCKLLPLQNQLKLIINEDFVSSIYPKYVMSNVSITRQIAVLRFPTRSATAPVIYDMPSQALFLSQRAYLFWLGLNFVPSEIKPHWQEIMTRHSVVTGLNQALRR